MTVVPGSDEWLTKYRLSTPSGNQSFLLNYADIVMQTLDLASLRLDGAMVDTSGCTAIGSTAYSRCNIDLPLGLFDLTGASPFEVMLGGGSGADSYFTYGGATFAPGISPPPPPPTDNVPEPASLVIFAAGLASLRWARRRKSA
jgi:hypothetical protein